MKTALTERQKEIFAYICDYQRSHMCCPTLAEISTHFNFSSANAARCHLDYIQKKGYITVIPRVARGITINRPYLQQASDTIPLLGEIAAGTPMLAQESGDNCIPISPLFFGKGQMFALRISGDSMINAGILNGDIAIITKQSDVDNGDIAAVLIENDATLKRIFKKDGKVILKAENLDFKDIEILGSDHLNTLILGKYQGIIRSRDPRGQI